MVLATVLALTGCGVVGFQAGRQAREASWAAADAVALPVAAEVATAVKTEATLPVAGPEADRVEARRVTDLHMEELFESLPKVPSERVDWSGFGDVMTGLTQVRKRVDQLAGRRTEAEKATAQTEVEAGYAPLVTKARGVVVALTDGLERYGVGPQAQARVRAARASATAGFATEDLKVEVLGALGQDKAPSRTQLVRIIGLDQQHRQQVLEARAAARASADGETESQLADVQTLQTAVEQWITNVQGSTEGSGSAVDPGFFARVVGDYRASIQYVTEMAASTYGANATDRLHQNWFRLGLSILAGLVLLVLLGPAWWWGRPTGNRVTSSGGETTTSPDEPRIEDEAEPRRSEAVHA